MTIVWPKAALPATAIAFNLAPRNTRGGAVVAYGQEQIVSSDAGRWVASLDPVIVRRTANVRLFKALQVILEGGLTPVLLPVCPRGGWPFPAGVTALPDAVPHSDDAPHDDDAPYEGGVIDVSLASGAALRATTLSLTKTVCGTIEPGHEFSLGERLYRIRTVEAQDSTTATITVRPPLREAALAVDRLEFDRPVCRMRLASDNAMDIVLEPGVSRAQIAFVEDLS